MIGMAAGFRRRRLPALATVHPVLFVAAVLGVLLLGLGVVPSSLEERGIIEQVIQNTTITDWVGGGNIRLRVEDAHFGDFRTYGSAEFTLRRVNGDKEFWNFADQVKVYIEDSNNFIPLIHGQSQVRMLNTTLIGFQAYGQSQVELINTKTGFEIEPSGVISPILAESMVGNQATVVWKNSPIDGRNLVFDQAKLTLEKITLSADAKLAAFGSAELTISNTQPQDQAGGTLYAFDQARVTIKNSRLATIVVAESATVEIISSEIGAIYRGLKVNGQAKIENGQLTEGKDQVVGPRITIDNQSKITEQLIGVVKVQPEGELTLIKTELTGDQAGIYTWGKVRVIESTIKHLFAYNPAVSPKIERSYVQYLYLAAHASSGKGGFEKGEVLGDLKLIKVEAEDSQIDEQFVGAVLAGGSASIKIKDALLERIMAQDTAHVAVADTLVRQITVSGQANANLERVVYAPVFNQTLPITPSNFFIHQIDWPDPNNLEQYPLYPWSIGQAPLSDSLELPLEVSGQARVSADLAAEEVRVGDQAELILRARPFELVNHLVARDRARITLYGFPKYPDIPGIYSTLLADQAVMVALDGTPGISHVLVMDDALLYQQTTSNQEVLMGALSQVSSNAMIVHVSKETPHFPGAGSGPETIAGQFSLTGTVFVNVWPMISFAGPVRHYAGLLNDYDWPTVEVRLDDQPLSKAEKAGDWPVFRLETDRFTDGAHTLSIRTQQDGKTTEREVSLNIRTED